MIFFRYIVFLALFAFCGSLTSFAQEGEKVKVRFVSFPKSADPQPVELLVGDGETILVDLPTNSVSSVYTITKPARWILGKTIVDAEGESTFQTYGTAPALASPEQLIIVIRDGKSDADGLKLVPFDDRTSNFGGGKYIFFNGSKVDIACILGETKFALKPLQHKLVAPKPSDVIDDRNYLYTYLYFRKGEQATPFYSSTWRFSEKARSMVFLYHDTHNQRLRIHTIRDYLP